MIECDKLVNDITNAYECENFGDKPSNQKCDQAAQQFFNDLLFTCNQDSWIDFPISRDSKLEPRDHSTIAQYEDQLIN